MELVDALKVLEATDGETREAFLCLWDDYCHIVSHDKWATDVAYAKVQQLDGLKSEFEAARWRVQIEVSKKSGEVVTRWVKAENLQPRG